jgi:hypothetical protein
MRSRWITSAPAFSCNAWGLFLRRGTHEVGQDPIRDPISLRLQELGLNRLFSPSRPMRWPADGLIHPGDLLAAIAGALEGTGVAHRLIADLMLAREARLGTIPGKSRSREGT